MSWPHPGARGRSKHQQTESEFVERVINVNRCAKVVKGGRRFSFNAIVAVGDQKGRVGVGLGKANEVADAIRKAGEAAKKSMFEVPVRRHDDPARGDRATSAPAASSQAGDAGTGVIAGGGVRAVLEVAGVQNVLTKSLGTSNPHNLVKATVDGLQRLRRASDVAAMRGHDGGRAARESGARLRAMPKIRITQERSKIRGHEKHKRTLEALGLRRPNHTVIKEDTPQIRGMIFKVRHLVRVEPTRATQRPGDRRCRSRRPGERRPRSRRSPSPEASKTKKAAS